MGSVVAVAGLEAMFRRTIGWCGLARPCLGDDAPAIAAQLAMQPR